MEKVIIMTKEKIYVPILKWKRAEHHALRSFPLVSKREVMPLIEVVLPTVQRHKDKAQTMKKSDEEMLSEMVQKYKDERMKEIPEEINAFWGPHPIYIDFSLIHDGKETSNLKVESINTIISTAMSLGLHVVPVVSLSDDLAIKNAVTATNERYHLGICVRIGAADLIDMAKLNDILETLDPQHTDLLFDMKDVKDGGEYARLFRASQEACKINAWRELIFASGAFPVNLSQCKLDEPAVLPRYDWLNWIKQSSGAVNRIPKYADYTIRTPLFDE